MDKYNQWIEDNVIKGKELGNCKEYSEKMAEVFPELKVVRGHYYCHTWGERGHFWLVDKWGGIIDPTKAQFPSKGNGRYVPWNEGDEEPTGKCLNCAEYVYNENQFCNDNCEREFRCNL
jgi:hypothetical protein